VIKNRVSEHVERAVIDITIENPVLGQLRDSQELLQRGIIVSSGGVRSIWLRNRLGKHEKTPQNARGTRSAQEGILPAESQLSHWKKPSHNVRLMVKLKHITWVSWVSRQLFCWHNEKRRPYLSANCYSRVALAKLYTEKTAIAA